MDLNEFKDKVKKAALKDWWEEKEATFDFSYINYKEQIKGIVKIYEYVDKQVKGWESKLRPLPNQFEKSRKYFEEIRSSLISLLNNSSHSTNINNQESLWRQMQGKINDIQNAKPLPFDHPRSIFLVRLNRTNSNYLAGAFNFITNLPPVVNTRDAFIGTLSAYETDTSLDARLPNRREAEEDSIEIIKKDFKEYVGESGDKLLRIIANSEKEIEEKISEIDKYKNEKTKVVDEWIDSSKSQFDSFLNSSDLAFKELEKIYSETLKFKKPAEYWSERAKNQRKRGWFAFIGLLGLVISALILLFLLLFFTPEQVLSLFFKEDKTAAIRWSIIFVTFISIIAFAIRTISKVMFSFFHLAQDSEERQTLTYFYLSLLEDKAPIDKENVQLIIQSLFSRADTGLLKDDSSPTMPNDLLKNLKTS